jgi:hypothetical protein
MEERGDLEGQGARVIGVVLLHHLLELSLAEEGSVEEQGSVQFPAPTSQKEEGQEGRGSGGDLMFRVPLPSESNWLKALLASATGSKRSSIISSLGAVASSSTSTSSSWRGGAASSSLRCELEEGGI